MSTVPEPDAAETDVALEYLEARFRIEPHPDANCRIIEMSRSGEGVRQRVVDQDGNVPCTCRAEIIGEDGKQRLLQGTVTPHCICPIFARHDCIATIESVESGELVVSIAVPDRDELVSLVGDLRDAGATPRLLQITDADDEPDDRVLEFEADSVTDKQLEAVRMAVELGYYDTPRKATLDDLAEHLDISRSAVSQRLTAVESKLVVKLFETDGGSQPDP